LTNVLSAVEFGAPRLKVFSNATAAPYPHDPKAIATLLAEHLVSPVRFADEVEAMYQAGARIFVEVGPRNTLTGLTGQILADRPHLAVAPDGAGRSGILQLYHVLGQLAAHGVALNLDRLYEGRAARRLNLSALDEETRDRPLPPSIWLINGGRARPREAASPTAVSVNSPAPQEAASNGDVPAPAPLTEVEPKSPRSLAPQPAPVVSVQSRASGTPMASSPNDGAEQVLVQFQQLMSKFLETQQQVMLAYLQGAVNGTVASREASALALPEVSTTLPIDSLTSRQPEPASLPVSERRAAEQRSVVPEPIASVAGAVARREEIQSLLLHLVSEKTGYPMEMLDPRANLEADLGIDSIKRVEILGALDRQTGLIGAEMEQASRLQTLEELTNFLSTQSSFDEGSSNLSRTESAQIEAPSGSLMKQTELPATTEEVKVPRFLLTAVEAPASSSQAYQIAADNVFVITDDEGGVAQSLMEMIQNHGGRAALIRMNLGSGEWGEGNGEWSATPHSPLPTPHSPLHSNGEAHEGIYQANLADPAAVAGILEVIGQRQGPVGGVIHLLPLKAGKKFEEMSLADWRERLQLEVKSLFYLAKAASVDLKRAGETGKSWLIAATAMGGAFAGDAPERQSFCPSQGGVAGFIKTLAAEWPQVQSKVVDLDANDPPVELAERLLREIAAQDDEVAVGYRGARRLLLRATPSPLDQSDAKRLQIDSNWVWLITGGARGITAEVACELAARYRPTILVVGRAPLPCPEESPLTAGLNSQQDLKAALMEQLRRTGQPVTLSQVEAAYTRLGKEREIRSNLATMERAGASVRYFQVDAQDEGAFGKLIAGIYRSYGRIDGVIHGAGIIEDKLIEDKTPDSFDRVFHTKADSALILSRNLRADSLRLFVIFSSVAGCFGSRGQCDYAAGNEVQNKLAVYLNRQWPGRVVAINWGPWMRTGMVSTEVQRQFLERGVQTIPPGAGRLALLMEIERGDKGHAEVVIGDGPWRTATTKTPAAAGRRESLPLLNGLSVSPNQGGAVEVVRVLDPAQDLYLRDHRLDNWPVLPAAMAMELMAEVAEQGWPDWKLIGIQSFRVLSGVVLKNGPRPIRVVARAETQPEQERLELAVDIAIVDLANNHTYYQATALLGERLPSPPHYELLSEDTLRPFPTSVETAYKQWLFQGPLFHGITKIDGINEEGVVATFAPSSPDRLVRGATATRWLIDPVVVDSAFQLAILWARAHFDMTPLPARFRSFRRFAPMANAPIRCDFRARASAGGHILETQYAFLGAEGQLLALLEDMELSCSHSLNRLAGQAMME
jgi:NAD(P)-dependent dehydrogenase (short-subunit alcohol dehydrogenase family)/acyl carrier protein